MRISWTPVLAGALMLALAGGVPAGGQEAPPPDTESAARALVPLLKSVKRRLDSQWQLQQGSLPNSPFTGRQSTIVALSLGKGPVKVDPEVTRGLNQLLAWKIGETAPDAPEAVLFAHWLAQLGVRSAMVGDPAAAAEACDSACVVERFTTPDARSARTEREREELRDQILLEALAAAVEEVRQ